MSALQYRNKPYFYESMRSKHFWGRGAVTGTNYTMVNSQSPLPFEHYTWDAPRHSRWYNPNFARKLEERFRECTWRIIDPSGSRLNKDIICNNDGKKLIEFCEENIFINFKRKLGMIKAKCKRLHPHTTQSIIRILLYVTKTFQLIVHC
jgi:hypothetical protein